MKGIANTKTHTIPGNKHSFIDTIDETSRTNLIKKVFKNDSKPFFIEIGANDGVKNDPNYKLMRQIKPFGILVEPIESMFRRLKKNYKHNPKMEFDNVVISDTNGTVNFHLAYRTTCSSLLKKATLDHGYYNTIEVESLTWKSFVEKHDVEHITMLHLDTEGFDHNIINQVLELGSLPKILEYEDNSLYSKEESLYNIKKLQGAGYKLYHIIYDFAGWDVICVLNK